MCVRGKGVVDVEAEVGEKRSGREGVGGKRIKGG